jgi:chromosome segregation ATPase
MTKAQAHLEEIQQEIDNLDNALLEKSHKLENAKAHLSGWEDTVPYSPLWKQKRDLAIEEWKKKVEVEQREEDSLSKQLANKMGEREDVLNYIEEGNEELRSRE